MKDSDKKLLLIGGTGFVGGYVANAALAHGFQPIVASRQKPTTSANHWMSLDLVDQTSVSKVIEDIRPIAVINLAAISDIDQAEQDKELATSVNVYGPKYLAMACAEHSTKLLQMSTDAVFSGAKEDYTESSPTNSVNFYGRTKAKAEVEVMRAWSSAVIVRTSLILGWGIPDRNSFLNKIVRSLREGKPVLLPKNEIRTPIDVLTLSECILEIVHSSFSGILHLGAKQSFSRYDLGFRLARLLHLDNSLIEDRETNTESSMRAPRHKNGVLNVKKAETMLATELLDVEETLQRAVETVSIE